MFKAGNIRALSANWLQLIINQFFGFVIFYVLSRQLNKNAFGELNWTLAVFLTTFSILSFGIDQVIIKKIAAGGEAARLLTIYCLHTLLSGGLLYSLLWIAAWIFPDFFVRHYLLLFIGVGKLFIYLSTPFKQVAVGLQRFNWLLYMSVGSNVTRGLALVFLSVFGKLTMQAVIIIFVMGDAIELCICLLISKFMHTGRVANPRKTSFYISLLRESLPQIGVVIFTSAISRFDWICIGLFVSDKKLAEYSFAYKIFEVSTTPLLAIAPLLVPFFARIFIRQMQNDPDYVAKIALFARLELVFAGITTVLLNVLWVPIIDPVTLGKYGQANVSTILILSSCIPALYLNNLLWSACFADGKVKAIFYVFAVTFCVNAGANITLIPLLGNEGAALAFALAIFVQTALYIRLAAYAWVRGAWIPLVLCTICAIGCSLLSRLQIFGVWMLIPQAILAYLLLTGLLRQFNWGDIGRLRSTKR